VGLANLGSESETCVGSRVRLVGVFISFEKNFYQLPFTPPSLVRRIGPSILQPHPGDDQRVHHFGDNGKGRVLSVGTVKVSEFVTLRRVALVKSLGFNLLSLSQLLDEGFDVHFKRALHVFWILR
jgi:hypothetical protein